MAFKLKDKGELFGYNEELSTFDTPVFEKNLGKNIEAEANRDGTIFISKSLACTKKASAVEHERVHLEQMKQNRLSYDNDTVTWKPTTSSPAKVYSRATMAEGAENLPWESEAYSRVKR
jgi:hypothetical protein